MKRRLTTAVLGAGCLWMLATVAIAGTPDGAPPSAPSMPAYGSFTPAYGPPIPGYGPATPAYGPPMPAFGRADGPARNAVRPSPRPLSGQIRMRQERTEDQYLLILDLDGLPPENVQIRPVGHSLVVRARTDARTHRSESFGDGRGYRESHRISTGSLTRRLPVPPDADLAGLEREDRAQQVRVMIPRVAAQAAPSWR